MFVLQFAQTYTTILRNGFQTYFTRLKRRFTDVPKMIHQYNIVNIIATAVSLSWMIGDYFTRTVLSIIAIDFHFFILERSTTTI